MIRKTLLSIDECIVYCDQACDGKDAVEKVKCNLEKYPLLTEHATEVSSEIDRQEIDSKTDTNGRYDLIFMDYQMPNMDGPTSIKAIRDLGYIGKIIGLTGNVLKSELDVMRKSGANDVLSKPVSRESLEREIQNLLEIMIN